MNRLAMIDRLYGSSGSKKAFSSPRKSETWVCMPEPCTPSNGLGMNVAWTPSDAATSFTTSRNVMTLSAMVSASVWVRSISCWLGESSWNEYSTGMPSVSRARMVCLRREPDTSLVVRSKNEPSSSGIGRLPLRAGREVEELQIRRDVEA